MPKRLSAIKFLVVDEADRMVELGHFRELDGIIDKIILPAVVTHDKDIIKEVLRRKSEPIKLKVSEGGMFANSSFRTTRSFLTSSPTSWSKWTTSSS